MQPDAPLQRTGEVFLDARSKSRALRVTWHHESGVVVLSLWRDNLCTATFRLGVDEVPQLIELLRSGLDAAYDAQRAQHPGHHDPGHHDPGHQDPGHQDPGHQQAG